MLLLLLLASASALPAPDESLQRLITSKFSAAQQACFKEDKFQYLGDGECYTLTSQGPCKSGQWLVLGEELNAECQRCPCCDKPLHVFMAVDEKCHHRVREWKRFCPHPGTQLRNDNFGEGICACQEAHARLLARTDSMNDTTTTPCYQLWKRGPCPEGQAVTPVGHLGARCKTDFCRGKGARWSHNDRCYTLGTAGPCPEGSLFNVHPNNRQPECVTRTQSIVKVPINCNTDNNGDCQAEVEVPRSGLEYAAELLMDAELHRKKRRTRT